MIFKVRRMDKIVQEDSMRKDEKRIQDRVIGIFVFSLGGEGGIYRGDGEVVVREVGGKLGECGVSGVKRVESVNEGELSVIFLRVYVR